VMKKKLSELWGWYRKLPWWGKLLCILPVVLFAGALVFYYVFAPSGIGRGKSDEKHEEVVDEALDRNEELINTLDHLVKTKKKEIATKLNQAHAVDTDTLKAREKIQQANSMEELLKLQKELGL